MTTPLEQRIVPFYGDELVAVQRPDSTIFVLFARLCDNLGLRRYSQARRVQGHAVLNEGLIELTIETEGGAQVAQCLRIDLLPLWLPGYRVLGVGCWGRRFRPLAPDPRHLTPAEGRAHQS